MLRCIFRQCVRGHSENFWKFLEKCFCLLVNKTKTLSRKLLFFRTKIKFLYLQQIKIPIKLKTKIPFFINKFSVKSANKCKKSTSVMQHFLTWKIVKVLHF